MLTCKYAYTKKKQERWQSNNLTLQPKKAENQE